MNSNIRGISSQTLLKQALSEGYDLRIAVRSGPADSMDSEWATKATVVNNSCLWYCIANSETLSILYLCNSNKKTFLRRRVCWYVSPATRRFAASLGRSVTFRVDSRCI